VWAGQRRGPANLALAPEASVDRQWRRRRSPRQHTASAAAVITRSGPRQSCYSRPQICDFLPTPKRTRPMFGPVAVVARGGLAAQYPTGRWL